MKVENNMGDQSILWGLSLSVLDNWGARLMIAGFIIGAVALIFSFASAFILYRVADKAQSELVLKTESLRAETAEANQRAMEASLKLEELRRQVAPRHIQRDVFLNALKGQPKANVEIVYLRDDPECFDVAQQIGQLLEEAEWNVLERKPIPPATASAYLQSPSAMSVGGQPSGVTVVTHSVSIEEAEATSKQLMGQEWKKTPWTVLYYALSQSLGKASGSGGGSYSPPQGTLRVVVAPRM